MNKNNITLKKKDKKKERKKKKKRVIQRPREKIYIARRAIVFFSFFSNNKNLRIFFFSARAKGAERWSRLRRRQRSASSRQRFVVFISSRARSHSATLERSRYCARACVGVKVMLLSFFFVFYLVLFFS